MGRHAAVGGAHAAPRSQAQEFRQLATTTQRLRKKSAQLDEKLRKDPIAAVNLRFDPARGLLSDPFEFDVPPLRASWTLVDAQPSAAADKFDPPQYQSGATSVQPLSLCLFGPYALVLAIRIEAASVLKLNWVVKKDPRESRVFLVDQEKDEYLYPLATDLTGEVVPGAPRIGLIAFAVPPQPTRHLELHFSGIRLGTPESHGFVFHYEDDALPSVLEAARARLALPVEVERWLAERTVRDLERRVAEDQARERERQLAEDLAQQQQRQRRLAEKVAQERGRVLPPTPPKKKQIAFSKLLFAGAGTLVLLAVLVASAGSKPTSAVPQPTPTRPSPPARSAAAVPPPATTVTLGRDCPIWTLDASGSTPIELRAGRQGERYAVLARNPETVGVRVDGKAAWVYLACVR